MTDEPKKAGLKPSNSTNMTIVGGAVAAVTMAVLGKVYGVYFEAGTESALAVIVAAALGYLPESGRK